AGCCSWTKPPSSPGTCSRRCGSRWRPAASISTAPGDPWCCRPPSNSSWPPTPAPAASGWPGPGPTANAHHWTNAATAAVCQGRCRAQETSESVADRLRQDCGRQAERFADGRWRRNAEAPGDWLRDHFALTPAVLSDLDRALDTGRITMRGYDRVLRVATTLADLGGKTGPDPDTMRTALALRTQET